MERLVASIDSDLYVMYLRKKGVTIGEGTRFYGRVLIDFSRPCMINIGRNCEFTEGVVILTHGYDWAVLREKYGEVLASSGKVVIEDNVFVGVHSVILKGVRIGRDTIIGAGSIVTHNIPPNSVAVGNPCRVVMSIDKYYEKRKQEYVNESKAYAFELYKKTGKVPRKEEFWEEFPLFLDRTKGWGNLPVKQQVGSALTNFLASKPYYKSFREFLSDAGVPADGIQE